MAIAKEAVVPGATGAAGEVGALVENILPLNILARESNLYAQPPALEYGGNLVVLKSIEKRFPSFIRCGAAFSPKDIAVGDLGALKIGSSVSEFRDAVARLMPMTLLGSVEGGEKLMIYMARPGKEEDLKELEPDLMEEGLVRLAVLKDENDKLLAIIFGQEK